MSTRALFQTLLVTLSTSLPATAQLVLGDNGIGGGTKAWFVDLNGLHGPSYRPLWSQVEVTGLAADDANGVLYVASFSPGLYRWAYGSPNEPTLVGTFIDSVTGSTLFAPSLTFAHGTLYAEADINGDKIFTVDVQTGICTPILALPSTTNWFITAFAFNPTDGLFYVSNEHNFGVRGVHSVDLLGTGAVQHVTPFPGGNFKMRGLSSEPGALYLHSDGVHNDVYRYDLATGQFSSVMINPIIGSACCVGSTWAPGLAISGPEIYCTPKLNSQGCNPVIDTSGLPSMTSAHPFTIDTVRVLNNKPGVFFYGFASNTLPFQGGTLCVAPPIRRTSNQSSMGGSPPDDCSGRLTFDFNAYAQSGADPGIASGTTLFGQFWYRDPAWIPHATGLSNAITWTMAP